MPANPATYCPVCGLAWQVRGCGPGKCGTWTPGAIAEQAGVPATPDGQDGHASRGVPLPVLTPGARTEGKD